MSETIRRGFMNNTVDGEEYSEGAGKSFLQGAAIPGLAALGLGLYLTRGAPAGSGAMSAVLKGAGMAGLAGGANSVMLNEIKRNALNSRLNKRDILRVKGLEVARNKDIAAASNMVDGASYAQQLMDTTISNPDFADVFKLASLTPEQEYARIQNGVELAGLTGAAAIPLNHFVSSGHMSSKDVRGILGEMGIKHGESMIMSKDGIMVKDGRNLVLKDGKRRASELNFSNRGRTKSTFAHPDTFKGRGLKTSPKSLNINVNAMNRHNISRELFRRNSKLNRYPSINSGVAGSIMTAGATAHGFLSKGNDRSADASAIANLAIHSPRIIEDIMVARKAMKFNKGKAMNIANNSLFLAGSLTPALAPILGRIYNKVQDKEW